MIPLEFSLRRRSYDVAPLVAGIGAIIALAGATRSVAYLAGGSLISTYAIIEAIFREPRVTVNVMSPIQRVTYSTQTRRPLPTSALFDEHCRQL